MYEPGSDAWAAAENKKRELTEESEMRLKRHWADQSMRFKVPGRDMWYVGERVKGEAKDHPESSYVPPRGGHGENKPGAKIGRDGLNDSQRAGKYAADRQTAAARAKAIADGYGEKEDVELRRRMKYRNP